MANIKGSKKEVAAYNSFFQGMRAIGKINARLNNMLNGKELTESQFGILEALLHNGPLYQRELADKLLKSGGNITMVVDNLEKLGYVKRERGENDRRYFTIHLTKQGKTIVEKIFPKYLEALTEEMSLLSEDEQVKLYDLCLKLEKKEAE